MINEPLIGAHRNKEDAIKALGDYFIDQVQELEKIPEQIRMQNRYDRLMSLGSFD
jgi:acetyl-CoA carboxylase carboxyl transferase subunit alpha